MGEVSGSTLTAATRERVAFPPRAERSARRASALVEVKCAGSQYEAFRGEIRKVGLAKKVAKNKENRYLAYPRSKFFLLPHFFSSQSKFCVKYRV